MLRQSYADYVSDYKPFNYRSGILTLFCTYGWAQGVWFHWFRSETVLPETETESNLITSQTPDEIAPRAAMTWMAFSRAFQFEEASVESSGL